MVKGAKIFWLNISNSFTSIISLTGLGCQSVDIAFKKRQIKVGFFLNLLGLLVGVQYSSRLGLLAIFGNLEFIKKFTFTISVTGLLDNVNVGYACITMGIYVDRIVCLKVRVHWLITSITTYSQLPGI